MKRIALALILLAACNRAEKPAATSSAAPPPAPGDVARGKGLITQYGCTVCHAVPGTSGPQGSLAPSLAGLASRPTFANETTPTNFDNLARYIVQPAAVNPQTSMPPMGVTDADARDLAAFLLTLK